MDLGRVIMSPELSKVFLIEVFGGYKMHFPNILLGAQKSKFIPILELDTNASQA